MTDYIKREDAIQSVMNHDLLKSDDWSRDWAEYMLEDAPTIDAIPVETVCEMFGNEAPCNYGLFGVSVDYFMMSKCGKWCEDNCDKVPYTECWQKFFEAIEKWRKQNG
jgi:hypothetical protein